MYRGFTLVELLVAMVILSVISLLGFQALRNYSLRSASEMEKTLINQQAKLVFSLIEDDLRHSSFALPKRSRVYLDASRRLFIADGWEMIKDFTDNGDVDGEIMDEDYRFISDPDSPGKCSIDKQSFCADIESSSFSSVVLSNLDINSRGDNDFKVNKGIIILNCEPPITAGIIRNISGRAILLDGHISTCTLTSSPVAVPAIVWYRSGDVLYRNRKRVVDNVVSFDVRLGYDSDGNGYVTDSEITDSFPDPFDDVKLKFVEISVELRGGNTSFPYKTRIMLKP